MEVKEDQIGILSGVILAVSKKLAHRQIELHNLASLLGADYRYVYDDSCTHLLHQVSASILLCLRNRIWHKFGRGGGQMGVLQRSVESKIKRVSM